MICVGDTLIKTKENTNYDYKNRIVYVAKFLDDGRMCYGFTEKQMRYLNKLEQRLFLMYNEKNFKPTRALLTERA